MLRKIELFMKPVRLNDLQDLLIKKGIDGMSVIEVQGFGLHSAKSHDGKPAIEKRLKIEIVVDETKVDELIKDIRKLVVKNNFGFGKIFIIPVEDALRVTTGEFGSHVVL